MVWWLSNMQCPSPPLDEHDVSDTHQVSAVLTSLYTLEDDDQGTYSQSGVPPSTLLSNVKMKAREVMNEYELQDDQAAYRL